MSGLDPAPPTPPRPAGAAPEPPAGWAEQAGLTAAQVHRRAVAMLVLLLGVVLAAVGYVLHARGVFEPRHDVVLLADDAEGVTVGMDLTFAGFPIGRVERLSLQEDGLVRIRVAVPRRNAHWLRTSSVVTLERSLVGGSKLRAFSGVMSDPPLPSGATLRLLRGDALAELPGIMATVKDILAQVEALTGPRSALAHTLADVSVVMARAAGPKGLLAAATGSDAAARELLRSAALAQQLLKRLDGLAQRTEALVQRSDGLLARAGEAALGPEGLAEQARALALQLRQAMGQVQASLRRADAVLEQAQALAANAREASEDLATLRAEVEASLQATQRLLADVQRRWPLARPAEVELP